MSVYIINYVNGCFDPQLKPVVATRITELHCRMTGDDRDDVHVLFFSDAPKQAIDGIKLILTGNVRSGRSEQKQNVMIRELVGCLSDATGLEEKEVMASLSLVSGLSVFDNGEFRRVQ